MQQSSNLWQPVYKKGSQLNNATTKQIYIKGHKKKDLLLSYGIEGMPDALYSNNSSITFYGEVLDISGISRKDVDITFAINDDVDFDDYNELEQYARKHADYDIDKSFRQHDTSIKEMIRDLLPCSIGFMETSKETMKLYSSIPRSKWDSVFELLNYNEDLYFFFTVKQPPRKRSWLI